MSAEEIAREVREHIKAMDRTPRLKDAGIYQANYESALTKLAALAAKDAEPEEQMCRCGHKQWTHDNGSFCVECDCMNFRPDEPRPSGISVASLESSARHAGGCDSIDGGKCNCFVEELRSELRQLRAREQPMREALEKIDAEEPVSFGGKRCNNPDCWPCKMWKIAHDTLRALALPAAQQPDKFDEPCCYCGTPMKDHDPYGMVGCTTPREMPQQPAPAAEQWIATPHHDASSGKWKILLPDTEVTNLTRDQAETLADSHNAAPSPAQEKPVEASLELDENKLHEAVSAIADAVLMYSDATTFTGDVRLSIRQILKDFARALATASAPPAAAQEGK